MPDLSEPRAPLPPAGSRVRWRSAAAYALAFPALTAIALAGRQYSITILVTGNTQGFLQSCGCADRQPVGMAQRATLVHQFRQPHRAALLLDTGAVADTGPKAAAVLEAMALLGYDAVAVQAADRALGEAYATAVAAHGIPVVGKAVQARWFAAGSGVRAVADPSEAGHDDLLVAVVSGASWEQGLRVAKESTASAGRAPDLFVCLGQPASGSDIAPAVLDAVGPRCGFLMAGAGPAKAEGRVAFAPVAAGGREVTVAEASRERDGGWRWNVRSVPVPADLDADPQVKAVIDRHYLKQQEAFLASQRASAEHTPDEGDAVRLAADLGYVPAWGCRTCHEGAFSRWQASQHARAVKTLADRNRLVPECIPCHSEEFRRTGRLSRTKPASVTATSKPAGQELPTEEGGVECASCHGPGLLHAALGTRESAERGSLKGCLGCHDAERSPKFDALKYWQAIRH